MNCTLAAALSVVVAHPTLRGYRVTSPRVLHRQGVYLHMRFSVPVESVHRWGPARLLSAASPSRSSWSRVLSFRLRERPRDSDDDAVHKWGFVLHNPHCDALRAYASCAPLSDHGATVQLKQADVVAAQSPACSMRSFGDRNASAASSRAARLQNHKKKILNGRTRAPVRRRRRARRQQAQARQRPAADTATRGERSQEKPDRRKKSKRHATAPASRGANAERRATAEELLNGLETRNPRDAHEEEKQVPRAEQEGRSSDDSLNDGFDTVAGGMSQSVPIWLAGGGRGAT